MEISFYGFLPIAILAYLIYAVLHIFVFKHWNYFSDRGVAFVRGVPFLGTFAASMAGRDGMPNQLTAFYERYSKHKFIGFYQLGGIPTYMINDVDMMKKIFTKDFDHFVNRGFNIDKDIDPIFARNLSNMDDDEWRNMRSVLSPLFTGSKMRFMLALMNETIHQFVGGVREDVARGANTAKEYNLTDLFACSTNDAIASCAFGFNVDSFRDPSNQFYSRGREVSYVLQSPMLFIHHAFPMISKLLGLRVVSEKHSNFFREVIRDTVDYRKNNNIVRKDMIHLMTLMREGKLDDSVVESEKDQDTGFATIAEILTSKAAQKLKNFTDDDIVAQCVIFFLAGFTGIAQSLGFLCYELALNPDVQDKLHAEVSEVDETIGEEHITFERLQKMTYLDSVVSETLRKWSANLMLIRQVTKQYLLDDGEGTKVVLQPGDAVWIPAYAIQRDPKFYPEPEKFLPERFLPDAEHPVNPDAYMPFGIGPRACIANRFALMQLKATVFHMVRAFHIQRGPNSTVPCKLKPTIITLEPQNGHVFELKLRK